jgi:hypothetical protein
LSEQGRNLSDWPKQAVAEFHGANAEAFTSKAVVFAYGLISSVCSVSKFTSIDMVATSSNGC